MHNHKSYDLGHSTRIFNIKHKNGIVISTEIPYVHNIRRQPNKPKNLTVYSTEGIVEKNVRYALRKPQSFQKDTIRE